MKRPYSLIVVLILFAPLATQAQNLDSLYTIWQDDTNADSTRISAFNDYIWKGFLFSNPDSAFRLAEELILFGQERSIRSAEAQGHNIQGITWSLQGIYPVALFSHLQSLKIYEEIGDKVGIAAMLNNIGSVYQKLGDHPKSLDYFTQSLKIYEALGNRSKMADSFHNIGLTYHNLENYSSALDYYRKSLAIKEELGDQQRIATTTTNLGFLYREQGDLEEAENYLTQSLKILESLGNIHGMASVTTGLGDIYNKQAKYTKALSSCNSALAFSKKIGSVASQRNACLCLYETYKALGDDTKALAFHENVLTLNDSIFNEENTRKVTQLEMQYEFDKKETAAKAEQQKRDAVALQELKRQKLVRNGFVGGFLVVLLFAGVFLVQRNKIGKEKRRSEELLRSNLLLKKVEADKLKELDGFKSRLYTNLTHEFRTPLTVILGMAEQIKRAPKKHLDEGIALIQRNSHSLLQLINQLLDLSKLESGSLRLKLEQGDIIPYLRYLTESFQTFANSKNLSLQFRTPLETLVMDYDPEQIKQVVTNLISNAVKFTPSGGEVTMRVKSTDMQLILQVADTGIGIDKNDLPHVFNRFYQADESSTRAGEGTGIGLSHAQELVRLMGGKIEVESEPGAGSRFTVFLPITKEASPPQSDQVIPVDLPAATVVTPAAADAALAYVGSEQPAGERPLLLIIEDNRDVVAYLRSCLDDSYELEVAFNGLIGIEKALELTPDLIISDVMMPEKNGYEVCDILKNDERTSHIPIILLTAKADAASKIEGLRRGADAYLAKPFDQEELLVRLARLVEQQQRMMAYFSAKLPISEINKSDVEVEDAFIQKVQHIIEQHYQDENFGLPQLCQKVRMSRSQLFRKLKALTGSSPSDFIRSYRLTKAKALLETSEMNVSEVAWEVGYKDIAHFSKSYKEAFGLSPSTTLK